MPFAFRALRCRQRANFQIKLSTQKAHEIAAQVSVEGRVYPVKGLRVAKIQIAISSMIRIYKKYINNYANIFKQI